MTNVVQLQQTQYYLEQLNHSLTKNQVGAIILNVEGFTIELL